MAFTGLCLFGMSRVRFENDAIKLLRSDKIEFKPLGDEFVHLERTTVIVVEGEDLLTQESVDGIGEIVEGVAHLRGVATVFSMLNMRDNRRIGRYLMPLFIPDQSPERYEKARQRALKHPLLIGHFLSPDLKTALLVVELDAQLADKAQFEQFLDQAASFISQCTADSGLRARITGAAALEVEIVANMRNDIGRLSLLGAGLVLLIAVVLFRRLEAVVVVASGPAVGTIWTVGTLGLIGEPLNMLTNVVPVLVLVIGFTDSMHLVLHMRRAMANGSTNTEAAQSAIRHLGLACALTSLSTAVGFGSLIVANLYVIKTFGWSCALGSILSFLAVITVVPLLASTWFGQRIVARKPLVRRSIYAPLADALLSRILSCPRAVLFFGIVLTVTLAALSSRLEPDHTIANEIPHASKAYQAMEHVDKTFGGVMFAYALVQWPQDGSVFSQEVYDVLAEVHAAFDDNGVVSNPLSYLNLLQSLPGEDLAERARQTRYVPREALRRLVSPERRRLVVSAHVPDCGARILNPAFDELERQFRWIERDHSGFRVELKGGSVTVFRSIHLMIEDLWKSLATAAGVMFLMILIGLRSWRYALVSLLPNVFPLLCAGSFIVLTGRYLEMSSVIVFSISLGIAVDDTIHFLVHFKQEMRTEADPVVAVRRTFEIVGTALVMTTVALVAGHAIVMLSGFPAIRTFGMITAVTIASALVGDLLILPAILVCVRWPSR
jgi:hypothetical protein